MSTQLPRVVHWRRAVLASELRDAHVRVAMTLAEHMNGDGGSCWPSIARLADEGHLSRRTVQYALRELEAAGWLEREGGGGRGRSSHYRAAFPDGEKVHSGAPFGDEEGRTRVQERAHERAQRAHGGAPKVDSEEAKRGRSRERDVRADAHQDRLAALDAHPRRFSDEELADVEGEGRQPQGLDR